MAECSSDERSLAHASFAPYQHALPTTKRRPYPHFMYCTVRSPFEVQSRYALIDAACLGLHRPDRPAARNHEDTLVWMVRGDLA